ncbi:hypothetical protein Gohar_008911, partial [Gossypium harknessii]|nr:hypothetical protein [Gossypium harknessii]
MLMLLFSTKKIGFGVIIRNFDGFFLGRGIGFKDKLMMIEWAELYAFEKGLKLARSLNIDNAIFKTDCASLVNRFKKCKDDITIITIALMRSIKLWRCLLLLVLSGP